MSLVEEVNVERFDGAGKHDFSWLPRFPYRLIRIECKVERGYVLVERFHLANIDVLWPRVGTVDMCELTGKEMNAPVMSEYNTLHFTFHVMGSSPVEVGFRYVRPEIDRGIRQEEHGALRGAFDWQKPVIGW